MINLEKYKNLIFIVSGGIGRNIFATAVIRNLKKAYPNKRIFVICGTQEVFFNNPNVNRVYSFNTVQHLYEDYIFKNDDTCIVEVEPYRHPDYMNNNMHIVKAWCDLLNIECDSIVPELYFTVNESNMAKAYLSKFNKPLVLLQHIGGAIPQKADDKMQAIASELNMYRRSLREETTQKIVDQLIADGYAVGSVQADTQFQPKNTEKIQFPIRAIMALIPHVDSIICIDSFLQHACAALNKKALVLWAGTNPEKLGYELHTNLRRNVCATPECHRPNSYAFDMQPNGAVWDCPFSDVCRNYEAETIINAFKEMKGESYITDVKNFKKVDTQIEIKPSCKECK
jgi:hypothetical protein